MCKRSKEIKCFEEYFAKVFFREHALAVIYTQRINALKKFIFG
jgi:hypothetical protein